MLSQQVSDELIKVFKIEKADPRKQQEFLSSLEELSTQTMSNFVLENLNTQDFQTFSNFLNEDESGEKAMSFAREKIPDFDNKTAQKLKEEIDKINY